MHKLNAKHLAPVFALCLMVPSLGQAAEFSGGSPGFSLSSLWNWMFASSVTRRDVIENDGAIIIADQNYTP